MKSLGQSMDVMNPSNPTRSRLPLDNPAIPDQLVLPVPITTHASKDRRVFYGFEVSKEWLIAYCERNTHRIRNYRLNNTSLTKIHLAKDLLAVTSGVKNLKLHMVLRKGADPTLDPTGNNLCTPLVSVCSSMNSSYVNRPSKPQMDKLKSIFEGREPDWYIDSKPSSFYED